MTKSDLINIVAKRVHLTKKATEETVEALLEEMSRVLQKGEQVMLSNFGTFYISKVKDKQVVPFGAEDKRQTIKAHKVINFRVAKNLKKQVW